MGNNIFSHSIFATYNIIISNNQYQTSICENESSIIFSKMFFEYFENTFSENFHFKPREIGRYFRKMIKIFQMYFHDSKKSL